MWSTVWLWKYCQKKKVPPGMCGNVWNRNLFFLDTPPVASSRKLGDSGYPTGSWWLFLRAHEGGGGGGGGAFLVLGCNKKLILSGYGVWLGNGRN